VHVSGRPGRVVFCFAVRLTASLDALHPVPWAAVHSWDAHGTPFDENPLTDKFLIY